MLIGTLGSFLIIIAESFLSASSASSAELPWTTRLGGIILFAVNAAFVGVYVTMQRPLLERISATVCTTASFVCGTPMVFLSAVTTVGDVQWGSLPLLVFAGFFWTAFLGTALVFVVFSWINKRIGSTVTAMGNALAPLVPALTFAHFVLQSQQELTLVMLCIDRQHFGHDLFG